MLWSTSGEGGSQGSGRDVRPAPSVPGAVGLELLVCMVSFVVAPSVLLTVGSFC